MRGRGLSGPVSAANQERETTFCNSKTHILMCAVKLAAGGAGSP